MTTKPKSRVGTIFLSFIPGAGHMYLGLLQRGLLFMATFAICVYFVADSAPFFIVLLPVIWFYQFFDALRCYDLPPYEREALSKVTVAENLKTIFGLDTNPHKAYKWAGIALIVVGAISGLDCLWGRVEVYMDSYLGEVAYNIISELQYSLSRIIPAVVIIVVGVLLIRGNKKRLEKQAQAEQSEGEVE